MIPLRYLMTLSAFGASALVPALAEAQSVSPGAAENRDPPGASLVIVSGLQVGSAPALQGRAGPGDTGSKVGGAPDADDPAMIQVSGDPNRLYRVRLLDPASDEAATVTIVSASSGDISRSRLALLNNEGRDTLQISGAFTDSAARGGTAAFVSIPLSLDYE